MQKFTRHAELLDKGETTAEHLKYQREEAEKIDTDKANTHPQNGGLFRGLFKPKPPVPKPIVDPTDGVVRCPLCASELLDGFACINNECEYTYPPNSLQETDDADDFSDVDVGLSIMDDDFESDDDFGDRRSHDTLSDDGLPRWYRAFAPDGPFGPLYGYDGPYGPGPWSAGPGGPFSHADGRRVALDGHSLPSSSLFDEDEDEDEDEDDGEDDMGSFIDDDELEDDEDRDSESDRSTVVGGSRGRDRPSGPANQSTRMSEVHPPPYVEVGDFDGDGVRRLVEDNRVVRRLPRPVWTESSRPYCSPYCNQTSPMNSAEADTTDSSPRTVHHPPSSDTSSWDGPSSSSQPDNAHIRLAPSFDLSNEAGRLAEMVDQDQVDSGILRRMPRPNHPDINGSNHHVRRVPSFDSLPTDTSTSGSSISPTPSPPPWGMLCSRNAGTSACNAIAIEDSDEEPVGPTRTAQRRRRARYSPY